MQRYVTKRPAAPLTANRLQTFTGRQFAFVIKGAVAEGSWQDNLLEAQLFTYATRTPADIKSNMRIWILVKEGARCC